MEHRALAPYFPSAEGEQVATYLFARTVACPRTGKPVPLSPNWWLSKDKGGTAVRLVTERDGRVLDACGFEIESGACIDFDPDMGTVAMGEGVSPWDGLAIDDEYIREEARAGRLGIQLYAVAIRVAGKRGFRAPTPMDLAALADAEAALTERLVRWESTDILPRERVPAQNPKYDVARWGMFTWRDFFLDRQILVHGTFVEEFRRIVPQVRDAMPSHRADAVLALLALMQGKALNWSAILSTWDTSRDK